MKKLSLMTLIFLGTALTASVYSFENENTTLKNEDSKTYEYIIRTACGKIMAYDELLKNNRVIYDCVVDYGKIDSHSRLAICNFGCELTLAKTGQTITVDPGDTVVIDKGVLKVR
jgi:hypothetical protein